MKNLLKGVAVAVVVTLVLLAINVFCNMHDVQLDAVGTGTFAAIGSMLIYEGLTKKEK